jgi:hypothetical protein
MPHQMSRVKGQNVRHVPRRVWCAAAQPPAAAQSGKRSAGMRSSAMGVSVPDWL